ncbi:hypothetical protein PZA11_006750 [Diplocarpon coronariae]
MRDATRPGQVAEVTEFGLALYKSYIKELLDCDLIEEGRTHLVRGHAEISFPFPSSIW